MVDFKYHYEADSGVEDWPDAAVIEVGSEFDISELLDLLISNVDVMYDPEGSWEGIRAKPLKLEFPSGIRISERSFWSVAIDVVPDIEIKIGEYVDAHIERSLRDVGGYLAFTSYLDVVGQEALYAYIDSRIRHESRQPLDPQKLTTFSDCFIRFLKACDMEHETYQNSYIYTLLDVLDSTSDQFFFLLTFRLFEGQMGLLGGLRNDLVVLQRCLNRNGMLRKVIDFMISGYDDGVASPVGRYIEIVQVCSLVYGTDESPTSDVLEYCREHVELEENVRRPRNWLSLTRGVRDAYIAFATHGLVPYPPSNTGFHEFSQPNRSWKRVF